MIKEEKENQPHKLLNHQFFISKVLINVRVGLVTDVLSRVDIIVFSE